MSDSEYDKWARHHEILWRMHSQHDIELILTWKPRLIEFTFAELHEASYSIGEDDKAGFREHHLRLLREIILGKRAEVGSRERERQEQQYASAVCDDCYGVGVVRVPHPDFISAGELTRKIFIDVSCTCAVGDARFNAINSRLAATESTCRFIGLSEYESFMPDWRLILAAAGDAEERDHAAAELGRHIDRGAGPIDARAVAERMPKP